MSQTFDSRNNSVDALIQYLEDRQNMGMIVALWPASIFGVPAEAPEMGAAVPIRSDDLLDALKKGRETP
jgi:hypothetical protein